MSWVENIRLVSVPMAMQACIDASLVNFFPHQVADLSIALDYLSAPDGPVHAQFHWRLRYILLLWLSLISMLPFDLSRFDEDVSVSGGSQSSTAHRIQSLAIEYLGRAGLERDAAAILLSKLYTRCMPS
jgi:tubulin-specific chaperone D